MTTLTPRTCRRPLAASACVATLSLGGPAVAMDPDEAERMLADPAFADATLVLDCSEAAVAAALEADGFQTLHSNRAGPMMHLAMHDALNAIVPLYEASTHDAAVPDADPVAAASQAAHDVLVAEFPNQAETFVALHADWLDMVPRGDARERGVALGEEGRTPTVAHSGTAVFSLVSERRACRTFGQLRATRAARCGGFDDEERLTADIIELARQYGDPAEKVENTPASDGVSSVPGSLQVFSPSET